MSNHNQFSFQALAPNFPPFIPRTQIQKYFPWLSAKRMANIDSAGRGPSGAIRNGRAVVYPTTSLLAWLDSRNQSQQSHNSSAGTDQKPYEAFQVDHEDKAPKQPRRGRKTKIQEVRERRGKK